MTKTEERRLSRLFSSEDWELAVRVVIQPEMNRLLMRLDASEDIRVDDKMRGGRQAFQWFLTETVNLAKKSVDNSNDME